MSFRFVSVLFLAAGLSSLPASAQFLSVGVKAGVPLNDAFDNGDVGNLFSTTTNRYIIGPQVEIRLPFHFGVEGDALYRHYVVSGKGASEWQFPILLKYHFHGASVIHPFIDGGPVFNHVSEIANLTSNQMSPGIAVGAGLDFKALFVHVTPEFRYVWMADKNYSFEALGSSLGSNQNQAQFLVGFSF
jgi:hypothetical protein